MIEIPFLPEFESALRDGRKTATSRSKKYGNPGDCFAAFGMTFQITEVMRIDLWDIAKAHYQEEGFESPEAFISTWQRIHPRKGFTPSKRVWFHRFKRLS